MATHSSILAWRIPWTEESGGLESMGFSRQEYWSVLPFPSPGDLPDPASNLLLLLLLLLSHFSRVRLFATA